MSSLIESRLGASRLAEDAVRIDVPWSRGRTADCEPVAKGRRKVRTTPGGRMVQPDRPGRPVGVRGPGLARAEQVRSVVPPADIALTMRLSDRGLALALGVVMVLMVAALVCIGSTAWRVTSEPGPVAVSVGR